MKKQAIQLSIVVVVLIVCIGGYLGANSYFARKNEKEENQETFVAFEVSDYSKISSLNYTSSDKRVSLLKVNEEWQSVEDKDKDLDEDIIDEDLLSPLSKISSESKIEAPEDLSQYGFGKDETGKISSETTSISAIDTNGKEYGIYIGSSNPYDSSKYYMMIQGDDNVYVVDSTISDAFSKTVDDLEKEEETTTAEETATAE